MKNPDRMKTVMINGVPYRMRGDMPFYEEMIQKDHCSEEIQEAFEEGYSAAKYDYEVHGCFD